MSDLFDHAMQERMKSEAPLAARMRPRMLDEYIGQEHIVGEGKLLRRAIESDRDLPGARQRRERRETRGPRRD